MPRTYVSRHKFSFFSVDKSFLLEAVWLQRYFLLSPEAPLLREPKRASSVTPKY